MNFIDIEKIITDNIVPNNNQEITADKLQYVLLQMNESFSEAVKTITNTTIIQFKGSLSSYDDLKSITAPNNGDTYLIHKFLYTYIDNDWVQTGELADIINTINVTIPRTLENGQKFNNWQTDFNISDSDLEMIKENKVSTVNITDYFNTLSKYNTATYAVGTISYNEHGNSVAQHDAQYGQITIAYSCDGTTIIYDIYIGYTDTKVYITKLKSTSDIIYEQPIYIVGGEDSDEAKKLIDDINKLQQQVTSNSFKINNLENTVQQLQINNDAIINSTINGRLLTIDEAEDLFKFYFQ